MRTWKHNWIGFKQTISDGCTMSPDLNFKECCEEHDFYYTKREKDTGISRKVADKRLRLCIKAKWTYEMVLFKWEFKITPLIIPWVYWCAVRCVGWKFWKK